MALTIVELLNAVQTDQDYKKIGTISRRFLVTTKDPTAARQADGVPPPNSPHPTESGYRADRVSTSPTGAGHTYVDIWYSNDRRFATREPNKEEPSWYHWGWGYVDATVRYFINVRTKTIFSDQADPVDIWNLQEAKLSETRLVRPLYVRLTGVTDPRWLDPIARQKNRLHDMPDGKTYRFLGGSVQQKDDSTYDVQYEWELDEGTDIPFGANSYDGRVKIPYDLRLGGFLRPPYYRLEPLVSLDPRNEPHGTMALREYVPDPLGWRQLPGANRVV